MAVQTMSRSVCSRTMASVGYSAGLATIGTVITAITATMRWRGAGSATTAHTAHCVSLVTTWIQQTSIARCALGRRMGQMGWLVNQWSTVWKDVKDRQFRHARYARPDTRWSSQSVPCATKRHSVQMGSLVKCWNTVLLAYLANPLLLASSVRQATD